MESDVTEITSHYKCTFDQYFITLEVTRIVACNKVSRRIKDRHVISIPQNKSTKGYLGRNLSSLFVNNYIIM